MEKAGKKVFTETLDPNDWNQYKELGRRIIDDIIEYLKEVEKRKVWQPLPISLQREYKTELPKSASAPETVYADAKKIGIRSPLWKYSSQILGLDQ